jgi:hypothetical protein
MKSLMIIDQLIKELSELKQEILILKQKMLELERI